MSQMFDMSDIMQSVILFIISIVFVYLPVFDA